MANFFNNKKKKHLLALALSTAMVASTVAGFAACKDSEDNSTDTGNTTTAADTATIKNGSFEFYNDNDGKNLIITAVDNWTKTKNTSNLESTPDSETESGIINTDEEVWNNFTKSALSSSDPIITNDNVKDYWSKMSAYDKLDYYDSWINEKDEKGNSKGNKITDLDFYNADTDNFNVDFNDVPTCANPLTHDYDPNATEDQDSSVLMIHNSQKSNYRGTAQKYTSSTTVTVTAGTSAKISLWVKTSDLTYGYQNSETDSLYNRGAYIGITHTVGGQTLDQFQVKNIDTEKQFSETETAATNGWVNYTFYLKGSSYSNSTFTMVLGLGQANGDTLEFVNGYAFFDDVECSIITNDEYEAATTDDNDQFILDGKVTINDEKEDKILLADIAETVSFVRGAKGQTTFALDLYEGIADDQEFKSDKIGAILTDTASTNIGLTEEKKTILVKNETTGEFEPKDITYIASAPAEGSGKTMYGNLNISTDGDITGVYNDLTALRSAATNDGLLSKVLDKDFGDVAADDTFYNSPILMMLSAHGANYTATIKNNAFKLGPGDKMAISFFLKTSAFEGGEKVTLSIIDEQTGEEQKLTSLDCSNVQPIDTDNQEDIYNGWQQCFFFVNNDSEDNDKSFSLKFTLGSTTVIGTTESSYYSGYAALANFKILENMSPTQFKCISTGTYSANAILDDEDLPNKDAFDAPKYSSTELIKTDIVAPLNYTGAYAGTSIVNNTSTEPAKGKDSELSDDYSGLINKNYIEQYLEEGKTNSDHWTNVLGLNTEEKLTAFFGGNDGVTQPLLIYSDKNAERAYGFIGQKQTMAADGSAPIVVSLRIKATKDAIVSVVLADMSDDYDKQSTLSIGRVRTYWYDDKGNVCDPKEAPKTSADLKKSDIAFRLESNGLYQATTSYANEKANVDRNGYYFNLALAKDKDGNVYSTNYDMDENGNLLVREGGVSYDYNNDIIHDGIDGIAFYYNKADGKYYADSNYKTLVHDFAEIDDLAVRYESAPARDLSMEIVGTGEWQTVTFMVMTGSQSKDYRLEIWNGKLDGSCNQLKDASDNPVGAYVLVANNTFTVSSKADFTGRIEDRIKEICKANDWQVEDFQDKYAELLANGTPLAGVDILYSTYSFYDTDSFLRYNADVDKNEIGGYYNDYKQSAYVEGVSYLKIDALNTIYADYSLVEQTPAVDEDPIEDTEDGNDEDNDKLDGADVWLLVSSLLVAVALLVAVVALIIRKVVAKSRKKRANTAKAQTTRKKHGK